MSGEEAESSVSARRREVQSQALLNSPADGPLPPFSTKTTAGEEPDSRMSARRREVEREALVDSPAHASPLRTSVNDPPPYGAQRRQDALWDGGNEVLPPRWHQFQVLDDDTCYQDDTLMIVSWNRPLPGVRLDHLGDLVDSGCEWYISPLGRSYFVNHNTRTTSWKKPTPERPAGSLTPECIIEGHSGCIWSLACIGTSYNIMSASDDGSIRRWKRDGEPVGKPWDSDRGVVRSIAVRPDATLVVCGSIDSKIRLWNIRKGGMVGDPWEGHNAAVRCLDWSPNALEIASGSEDGTIRRWDPDTGRQIAPPIEAGRGWVHAVKYSPQGDKFTSCGADMMIRVWAKEGELLIEIKGHEGAVRSLCWSKDSAYIFSASNDCTIRKWRSIDGKELVVLRGHTTTVNSLCLSPDECHLVSASRDCSVRIWDLKTNQPVGGPLLHDDQVFALAMFPDGKHIASAGIDAKIYVWSLEAALKHQGGDQVSSADDSNPKLKGCAGRPRDIFDARLVSQQLAKNRGLAKYGDDFWGNDTNRTVRRGAPPASSSSFLHWCSLFGSLRFSARPTDAPQPTSLQPWRWNFSLFSVGSSSHPVNVALARDEDRYGIAPETDAEAAAAMQRTNGNEADSSTHTGQPVAGVQGPQGRPTETQGSTGGTGEVSYEVNCCGLFFGVRRPSSHQA